MRRMQNLTASKLEKSKEKKMKIKITLTDALLGTASANQELYEEFIGGKCADKEKVKEELQSLETEELVEKTMTIFHRKDRIPILYDYQIRGFIKEAIGAMVEFGPINIGKVKFSKWTYKRLVDDHIFVKPREIKLRLPGWGKITNCTRSLRATTQRGERIALAHSEEAPKGTEFECEITWNPPVLEKTVREALDFGQNKGLGQWRNSGKGRFIWAEI